MQEDLDEIFHYNSCKKVAQLFKVMYELKNEILDNNTERKVIRTKFEKKLNNMNTKAERTLDNSQTALIEFRRNKIDDYCVIFGAEYKQLKADYAQKIADINDQYAKMSKELKDLGSQIVQAEKFSLKTAAQFLDSTENDIKAINTQNSKSNTVLQKEISVFSREFRNRNAELDKTHKENLRNITAEHNKLCKSLRMETQSKICQNIRDRFPELTDSRDKLTELEQDIKSIREDYNSVLKSRLSSTKSFINAKKRMQEDVKAKIKELFMQMRDVKKSINTEKSDFESSVFQIQKKMRMNKTALDKKIAQINSQISRQKQQLNQLKDKIKMDKRDKQMTEKLLRRESEKDIKMEKQKMQDELAKTQSQLEDLHKTTTSLLSKSKKFINEQINALQKKKDAFIAKINSMDLEKAAKSGQAVFVEILPIINTYIENKIASNTSETKDAQKKYRQEFNDQKKILITLLDDVQKKTNDASANNKQKNKENISKSEVEITQKFENINSRLKDRKNKCIEKEKVVKASFDEVVNKRREELKEIYKVPKEKLEVISESSFFTRQKDILLTNLNNIVGQIDYIKKYNAELAEKLDFELSNSEKAIRTVKRKMTTDEEEIKKSFNDSINASQVKLTQIIDNLSQLYDADANQRGSEIITQIRLVRECKNSMDDNIVQMRRETSWNMRSIKAECEKIKEQIRILSDGTKERELKEIIASKESTFQSSCEQLNQMYDDAVREINDEIQRAKSDIESAKNEINAKIDEENAIYAARFEEAQSEIENAKNEKDEKLQAMKSPHAEKLQASQDKHKTEKEAMKRRIDARNVALKENMKEFGEKISTLKKENQDQFDRMAAMKEEDIKNKNYILGDELLNERIENLCDRISNMLSDYISTPSDPMQFSSSLFTLVTESQQKTEEIENTFSHIIDILGYSSAEMPTERKVSGSKTSRQKIVRPSSGIVRRVSNV